MALAAVPLCAWAGDDAPDITGKWVGTTFSIVAGTGGHWPESAGTFEQPGLYEKDIVIDVTGQKGARFWGVYTLWGDGESTDEPFIGELYGKDKANVLIADTDGYLNGTIEGDTLTFCYANAGGPTMTSVVSCTEVSRQP